MEVFRGTPMVLQAVFIFYGLPYFTDNALKFTNIWVAAIVVVSINTGAYMAEIIRGGIMAIDTRVDDEGLRKMAGDCLNKLRRQRLEAELQRVEASLPTLPEAERNQETYRAYLLTEQLKQFK